MANDYYHWSKSSTVNVEAFPGVVAGTVNTWEKMLGDGNPDASTKNRQILDYINEKGYPLLYYPYLYEYAKAERVNGEHGAAGYGKPMKVYATFELKDTPSFLTAYGFDQQTTFTSFLHIDTWREAVRRILLDPSDERHEQYKRIYSAFAMEDGESMKAIEPHPKDLLQLMTFGEDRENGRGNRIFEITNVEDEILSENFNDFFGHYVWKLTGVRYRYSYEDGMSSMDPNTSDTYGMLGKVGEKGNEQLYDTATVAKIFRGRRDVLSELSMPGREVGLETEGTPLRIAQEGEDDVVVQEYPKTDPAQDIGEKDSKNEYDMSANVKDVYKTQA